MGRRRTFLRAGDLVCLKQGIELRAKGVFGEIRVDPEVGGEAGDYRHSRFRLCWTPFDAALLRGRLHGHWI
jgi:hypothetical protein